MFIAAPFTGFTEPVRPYSFGGVPTYTTEAQMIATYLNESVPDAKVGILYQNDDFGRDYLNGMIRFFEGDITATAAYDHVVPGRAV
ncbi:MAG: hypothetical protein QN131_15590, partial [Armatimonadota bacterium]|nr:hypothetical protein [Armatimonadota bacterium]